MHGRETPGGWRQETRGVAVTLGANTGLVEPRLVKVRAGLRGAGWALGSRGVLTARHVIAPFLEGVEEGCLAVPDPRPGAPTFACAVIWDDPERDLALLRVESSRVDAWVAAVGPG